MKPAVLQRSKIPRTLASGFSVGVVLLIIGIGSAFGRLHSTDTAQQTSGGVLVEPVGARIESYTFHSDTLDKEMPIRVLLPPGYDSGNERYPVLYMLHGMGPTATEPNWEWEVYGIFGQAYELMSQGVLQSFIVALPQGEQSYWVDHADGPAWGRYLAEDVVSEIDGKYRTMATPSQRAVGGLSMGADGALQVALNYAGVFGIVGLHSPAMRTYEEAPSYFGDHSYFDAHTIARLVEQKPDVARGLIIELDSGESDLWLDRTTAFHAGLQSLDIEHEWNVWAGEHNGDYWAIHIADYLTFYDKAFRAP